MDAEIILKKKLTKKNKKHLFILYAYMHKHVSQADRLRSTVQPQ